MNRNDVDTVDKLVEWIENTDSLTLQEATLNDHPSGAGWVTVERLNVADPVDIAGLYDVAKRNGWTVGTFEKERYGGQVTFYE